MLERIVGYLHAHRIPFRLSSHPSPEPRPLVAHRPPPGSVYVDTHVIVLGGEAAIACTLRGAKPSLARLKAELGVAAVEGTADDLPGAFQGASGPLPPLGGAMGITTIIDEALASASAICFAAWSPTDVFDVPYDDFARLEQPKVASFAIGGELPEDTEAGERQRRSA